MDFIALTLEEANDKALKLGVQLIPEFIDKQESLVNDSKYRVVNQKKENGAIRVFLMIEA